MAGADGAAAGRTAPSPPSAAGAAAGVAVELDAAEGAAEAEAGGQAPRGDGPAAGRGQKRYFDEEEGKQQQQEQQERPAKKQEVAADGAAPGGAAAGAAAVADAVIAAAATGVANGAANGAATTAAAAAAAAAPAVKVVADSNWKALKQLVAAPAPVRTKHAPRGAGGGARKPGAKGDDKEVTQVLAIDCEMVGTGPKGSVSALARVCVVNAAGVVLLDTFVQPKDKVTDFRTWVSGVRPSDVAGGRPHDEVVKQVAEMVKGRILVGHSIMNDLRALSLEDHPRALLRDTAKYPPLLKVLDNGRKVTASLKDLASTHLGLAIQEGEHSPVDDARATLYLYQKHKKEWEAAARAGLITVGGGGKAAGGKGQSDRRKGSGVKAGSKRPSGGGSKLGVKGGRVEKRHGKSTGGALGGAKGAKGGKGAAAKGPKPIWELKTDHMADL